LLTIEYQNEAFSGQVSLEMGIDWFAFSPRVRDEKYSRVHKKRQSDEMPEHSLCLYPESPWAISVMTIYCDFHKNFILRVENYCLICLTNCSSPLLNIDIILTGVVVGFSCAISDISISESFFGYIAGNFQLLHKLVCNFKWHLSEQNYMSYSVIPWPLTLNDSRWNFSFHDFKQRNFNIKTEMVFKFFFF